MADRNAGNLEARKVADGAPPVQEVIEYLSQTWVRDRNEVEKRLLVLLTHLLKWERQPYRRSQNWKDAIERHAEQLRELLAVPRKHFADETTENKLRDKVERWPLKDEAAAMLESSVYAKAVRLVIAKTGMRAGRFPDFCPYSLDEVLKGVDGLELVEDDSKKKRRPNARKRRQP